MAAKGWATYYRFASYRHFKVAFARLDGSQHPSSTTTVILQAPNTYLLAVECNLDIVHLLLNKPFKLCSRTLEHASALAAFDVDCRCNNKRFTSCFEGC